MMRSGPQDRVPDVFRIGLYNDIDFFEVSIECIQNFFSSGYLTSVQYTVFCLERIQRVFSPDPLLAWLC